MMSRLMMSMLLSLALCIIVLAVACPVRAEMPAAKGSSAKDAPPYKGAAVVVVDVRYILKHHAPLAIQIRNWNQDLKKAKDRRESELKEIQELERRLHEYVEDSPDYVQFENDIIKRQVESEVAWKTEERRLLRRRAKMYSDTYELIHSDVNEFMKENEISLVLNFDGDPMPTTSVSIAQLAKATTEWEGGFRTGWRADDEESFERFRTTPEQVEQKIGNATVGVSLKHDVTPKIMERLRKKATAEEKTAAAKKSEAKK